MQMSCKQTPRLEGVLELDHSELDCLFPTDYQN